MVEMAQLDIDNYSIKDMVRILAIEYDIQVKLPRPQGDTPEYLKHFNDNIWAYKIEAQKKISPFAPGVLNSSTSCKTPLLHPK